MREEVRAALDGLVTALEAHAEAAAAVARPDIPDPLPQAIDDLVAAVEEYRRVVEHWTGALVPFDVTGPDGTARDGDGRSDDAGGGGGSAAVTVSYDDVDWAGDAERWR